LKSNMGFRLPDLNTQPEVQIGRELTNGSVVLTDNYLPLGLLMNNWHTATVSGNLLAPRLRDTYVVSLDQTLSVLSGTWNNNTYVRPPSGNAAMLDSVPYSFSEWQAVTGID